MLNTSKW